MDSTLGNYTMLVKLDLVINNMQGRYPFRLNEQAKYTQHEIQLYQHNYCGEKKGGAIINIAVVDI